MNTLETSVSVQTSDNKSLTIDLSAVYNSVSMRAHIPDEDLQNQAIALITEEVQSLFGYCSAAQLESYFNGSKQELPQSLAKVINKRACDDMYPVRVASLNASIRDIALA
tara:strand:+ start:406 stop:735 length:330 start_codon:yes stop_codon:yes gene_type:complete